MRDKTFGTRFARVLLPRPGPISTTGEAQAVQGNDAPLGRISGRAGRRRWERRGRLGPGRSRVRGVDAAAPVKPPVCLTAATNDLHADGVPLCLPDEPDNDRAANLVPSRNQQADAVLGRVANHRPEAGRLRAPETARRYRDLAFLTGRCAAVADATIGPEKLAGTNRRRWSGWQEEHG
jgi:hypothetical protein